MQRYINNSLLQKKPFLFDIVVREATPHTKGWRIFCGKTAKNVST